MPSQNQTNITWQAWEYKHYPKDLGWYVSVIAVFIMGMAFFVIIQNDIFAAVCLGIICGLIVFFARQSPQRVDIELNGSGIHFGNLFYPYKQIKYFWVVHNERHQTINFHTTALVNNTLILELENEDPEMVRKFLGRHLQEHTATEETPTQKVMHKFKF